MSFQTAGKRPGGKAEPIVKPLLGTEIDAKCRKCKAVTKHLVVAKVGVKPTRVTCTVCELEHEYTVSRPRRASEATPPPRSWPDAMARAHGTATAYSASDSYTVGARITHPSFGEGVVIRLASPTVCEVVFEERPVKLVMKSRASEFVAPQPRESTARGRGRRFR
jgi:hypothetical protein